MLETFGGYTHLQHQMKGAWKMGGVSFLDDVTILRILDDGLKVGEIARLRDHIRRTLCQESVLIVKRLVEAV